MNADHHLFCGDVEDFSRGGVTQDQDCYYDCECLVSPPQTLYFVFQLRLAPTLTQDQDYYYDCEYGR